jgi:hypothetical protein
VIFKQQNWFEQGSEQQLCYVVRAANSWAIRSIQKDISSFRILYKWGLDWKMEQPELLDEACRVRLGARQKLGRTSFLSALWEWFSGALCSWINGHNLNLNMGYILP